jgi:hypothetical protein
MFTKSNTTTSDNTSVQPKRISARISLFFLAIVTLLVLLTGCSIRDTALSSNTTTALLPDQRVFRSMSIVINQPGFHQGWPAYTPEKLTVPAHSTVTLTIRNYDLGDTTLPKGSPYTQVQGISNNIAYADGHPYTSLAPDRVAHTFTISQLNINVPIPGDTTTGKPYATITFTFHTGAAGTYMFECFDPCGMGTSGWLGPMTKMGYMMGTVSVQ